MNCVREKAIKHFKEKERKKKKKKKLPHGKMATLYQKFANHGFVLYQWYDVHYFF